MTAPSIEEDLLNVAAHALGVAREDLNLQSGNHSVGTWDSLGHVTLVDAVEEAFSVSFPATEIVGFETLQDIHDAVLRHRAGG